LGPFCFAQEEIVTAEKLTKSDVQKALRAGEISGDCRKRGFSGASAASLNTDTIIIKGIYQKDGTAKIHFFGRLKKGAHADEIAVICEADLIRLDSGEWMDPKNGNKLTK
jgi:hypothetical protein